jgi:hypothetical protein
MFQILFYDYISNLEGHVKQPHFTRLAWIEGFVLFLYEKYMEIVYVRHVRCVAIFRHFFFFKCKL